jgi:DNA-binding GntR family transcriptional regulator
LHAQIAKLIRDDIEAGILQPGARLPPEPRLADYFGMSVAPVRQGLLSLVNEGYLERRQGNGTFVRPRIIEHLSMLSGFAEAFAEQIAGAELEVLSRRLERSRHALGQLSLAGQRVFVLRRVARIGGTPAALVSAHLDPRRFPGLERLDWNGRSLSRTLAELYDTELTRAVSELDLVRASRDLAVLNVAPGSLMLRVTSSTYAGGELVEYTESLYRPDCFRLRFESLKTVSGMVNVAVEAKALLT